MEIYVNTLQWFSFTLKEKFWHPTPKSPDGCTIDIPYHE